MSSGTAVLWLLVGLMAANFLTQCILIAVVLRDGREHTALVHRIATFIGEMWDDLKADLAQKEFDYE